MPTSLMAAVARLQKARQLCTPSSPETLAATFCFRITPWRRANAAIPMLIEWDGRQIAVASAMEKWKSSGNGKWRSCARRGSVVEDKENREQTKTLERRR